MDSPRPESEGISIIAPMITTRINTLIPTMAGTPPGSEKELGSENEILGSLNEDAPREVDFVAGEAETLPEPSGGKETISVFWG